ncbi:PREDICTED: uncharacterized protein LOC18587480 isoform X5 [Theobroma cacao]|uniref:Uncharacterized protein LOC18587480 isoform X5 n=1 Tax=Theobroma cacao TaxID=3641 RepID=A0AB32X2G2_THECC|nr:PREDICTED: uncharacterized protein LOC18587480 isoform X5 [Theobroma cacao]
MSSSSMLFRGGRGIRLLAFQHFPTLTTASTSSSTRIVSFSSYPYPTSYKIFSRNHCTFQNIFKLSLTSPSGCGVVGFSKMASAAGGEDGHFKLSETSELIIKKGDITRWFVDGASDAIVNPANQRMLGGGGADGGILAQKPYTGLLAQNFEKHAIRSQKFDLMSAVPLERQGLPQVLNCLHLM